MTVIACCALKSALVKRLMIEVFVGAPSLGVVATADASVKSEEEDRLPCCSCSVMIMPMLTI